jgi:hypothetical protein
VVQINAIFHIQEYIFTVGKPFDIQIQQNIHQPIGIDAGSHVANAFLSFKNRAVHGQNHTSSTGRLHNPEVGQLLPG